MSFELLASAVLALGLLLYLIWVLLQPERFG
jgi:K+-transporting ATPase KdpF subunit